MLKVRSSVQLVITLIVTWAAAMVMLATGQPISALTSVLAGVQLTVIIGVFSLFRRVGRLQKALSVQIRQYAFGAAHSSMAAGWIVQRHPDLCLPITNYTMLPENLLALMELVEEMKPQLVVELGTGITTLVLAQWFKQRGQGKLVAIEHHPQWASKLESVLERQGLRQYVDLHVVPLQTSNIPDQNSNWYGIKRETFSLGSIDLLVVDGPPAKDDQRARYAALPFFDPLIASGGAVFADDAGREGDRAVLDSWCAQFPAYTRIDIPTISGAVVLRRSG